jgi:hypothetical protein
VPFFFKKVHITQGFFLGKITSRFLFERTRIRLVSPGKTWGNKKAFEFNHKTLGGLSIRDPQGSSSVQILVVGPCLAHCLTEEAWRQTTLTPSRIGWTSRFPNRKYLL